jgi:hypothetical protein
MQFNLVWNFVIFQSNKNLFASYVLRFNSLTNAFREISLCIWRAPCVCAYLFLGKKEEGSYAYSFRVGRMRGYKASIRFLLTILPTL